MGYESKYTGAEIEQILDNSIQKTIEIPYSELLNMYKNKQLVPGQMYAITDYECSYKHPSSGSDEVFEMTIPSEDVKYIILTAIDTDRFDYSVQYIRHEGFAKILECKYAIDPEEVPFTTGMTIPAKGAVFYMKDEYENECSYDFKHVKFRRYAIKNITANMDINDGTGETAGPYKCMMTDTAYKFSDTRAVIGSGDNWDKTFIPALFNGKWGNLVSYSGDIGNYDDAFIINNIKPYQNEQNSWDKYLAWQKDMRETGGLSSSINRGKSPETVKVYGQANVEIDPNDYKDRYTFDYNGQDLSEMYTSTGSPKVRNMAIINTYCGYKYPTTEVLPNTIIAVSENAIESDNTIVQTSKFTSDTGVAGVKNNTILLRAEEGYNYSRISNLEFIDGEWNSAFRCNLFIIGMANDCNIVACMNNLLIGDFFKFDIKDYMSRNVLFGYYSNLKGYTLNDSLLYSDFYKVQYEGQAIKDTADGNYWYDTVWRDWFAYNIIGPNQYSSFQPHFNTNTVRGCYNKGAEWHPTNQGSSYGRCVWGTNIQYSATSGGIKFNDLIRVDIAPHAFMTVAITNSKGQEMFNNDQIAVPNIYNCDIRSRNGNPQTITTDLTESQLSKLSNDGNNRYVLTTIDDKWKLLYQNGVEVQ